MISELEKSKQNLIRIDLKSIRSIREYIAAQKDCPEILKEHELDAIAERGKING